MELYEYLRLFHSVTAADFEALQSRFKQKRAAKDQYLIMPGQVQRELLFVRSGVQMSYFDAAKKIHVVAFTYAPNLCAIPESFLHQVPSRYALKCITDSAFDLISFDDLQFLLDRYPALDRLFRKMTEHMLVGVINRHVELHALPMEERFRAFCHRSAFLLHQIPHKYIASYLAIDPTNFSKLYNSVRL